MRWFSDLTCENYWFEKTAEKVTESWNWTDQYATAS